MLRQTNQSVHVGSRAKIVLFLGRAGRAVLAMLMVGCASTPPPASSPAIQDMLPLRRYEVVPGTWITFHGMNDWVARGGPPADPKGYIFPSLSPLDPLPKPVHVLLPNFFRSNNRFADDVFQWTLLREPYQAINVRVSRLRDDATIDVDPSSVAGIRQLDWDPFQRLQGEFLDWLFSHSCWLFCSPEARFGPELRQDLVAFWRDNVLEPAEFGRFAATNLNSQTPVEIHYEGDSGVIDKKQTTMFATRMSPDQLLSITWGNENVYPPVTGGLAAAYSRATSGGTSEVQVVWDRGMRLYPRGTCGARSLSEQQPAAPTTMLPYPPAWAGQLGHLFIPIYNAFDLHNPDLLTAPRPHDGPADCPDAHGPSPRYLFLLTPGWYIKADVGPAQNQVAQFENEARQVPQLHTRDENSILARQSIILGCDSSDIDDVEAEWSRILETIAAPGAPAASPGLATEQPKAGQEGESQQTTVGLEPAVQPRRPGSCHEFVHGVFSGKAFVELRQLVSINGRPAAHSALTSETLGQVLASSLGAHLNAEGEPGSRPLLELRRPAPWSPEGPRGGAIRVRFHSTIRAILDQVTVLQGDEIYAGSVSQALR